MDVIAAINLKDAYRPLTHPLPAPCHENYPFYTPGGADVRWLGNDETEESGRGSQGTIKADVIRDIKRELRSELDDMLKDLTAASSAKFDALEQKLRDAVHDIVTRDGDRVISSILAGPHDSIKDPVSSINLHCSHS